MFSVASEVEGLLGGEGAWRCEGLRNPGRKMVWRLGEQMSKQTRETERMTRQSWVPIRVLKIRYGILSRPLARCIIYEEVHSEIKRRQLIYIVVQ